MENSLFKEKNVLITGATGLIGSYLVRKMLKLGANVIALGRNAQKIESVFKDEIKCENFRLISMNISKSFLAKALILPWTGPTISQAVLKAFSWFTNKNVR